MSLRSRLRFGSRELIVVVAVGVITLIAVMDKLSFILQKLYSPYAGLIAVIMLVEYIILKGADRSALYRRELDSARAQRRDDLLTFRRMESTLTELRSNLQELEAHGKDAERLKRTEAQAEELLKDLQSRV